MQDDKPKYGYIQPDEEHPLVGPDFLVNINEWQLCPKCSGEGTFERIAKYESLPPITVICDLCNGKKIISKVNGLPPQ